MKEKLYLIANLEYFTHKLPLTQVNNKIPIAPQGQMYSIISEHIYLNMGQGPHCIVL